MATVKSVLLLGLLSTTALSNPTKRHGCNPGRVTVNGRPYTISCGMDRPGGDYGLSQTNDFQGCVDACTADSNCISAQFHDDNGFCYFKQYVNDPTIATNEQTIDLGFACKMTSTVTLSGLQCTVSCGTDRHGGDYKNARTGNYLACAQLCADDSGCATAQYNEGNGYCYLKNQINNAVSSSDTDTIDCNRPAPKGKDVGDSCTKNGDCTSNQCTSTNLCGPLPNDYYQCKYDYDCQSGYCPPAYVGASYGFCSTPQPKKDTGATCLSNGDCKSNMCTSTNYCGPTVDGTLCSVDYECQSNYCNKQFGAGGYGNCARTPAPGSGAGGDGCRTNDQCASNQCFNNFCGPYPLGYRCDSSEECGSGNCAYSPNYGAHVCQ